MVPPPETIRVTSRRIACDGSGDGIPPALGHPRSWLEIDEGGRATCGYCDREFVLIGGLADASPNAPGDIEGPDNSGDEDSVGR